MLSMIWNYFNLKFRETAKDQCIYRAHTLRKQAWLILPDGVHDFSVWLANDTLWDALSSKRWIQKRGNVLVGIDLSLHRLSMCYLVLSRLWDHWKCPWDHSWSVVFEHLVEAHQQHHFSSFGFTSPVAPHARVPICFLQAKEKSPSPTWKTVSPCALSNPPHREGTRAPWARGLSPVGVWSTRPSHLI